MSRSTVLSHVAFALANEGSIEKSGVVLEGIARQLGYAGVEVTPEDLRQALDGVSVVCPSSFGPRPPVSTHYGPWGLEYRLRPSSEVKDATRACTEAVYAVTDTMDRTPSPVTINGQEVEIETTRPRAFATALGHLRVRWAKGNFAVPLPSTIKRWVGLA